MALEDWLESEVAVAVAATTVVLSPKARRVLRRGAVYAVAGALTPTGRPDRCPLGASDLPGTGRHAQPDCSGAALAVDVRSPTALAGRAPTPVAEHASGS
jgi:hypothetical protein